MKRIQLTNEQCRSILSILQDDIGIEIPETFYSFEDKSKQLVGECINRDDLHAHGYSDRIEICIQSKDYYYYASIEIPYIGYGFDFDILAFNVRIGDADDSIYDDYYGDETDFMEDFMVDYIQEVIDIISAETFRYIISTDTFR